MKHHLDELEALPIELVTQSLWDSTISRLREVETQALKIQQDYYAAGKQMAEVELAAKYAGAIDTLESIANGDGESALWAKQALSDLGLRS